MFFRKNKVFIIILSILLCIIVYLTIKLNNEITFTLNGESVVSIEYGSNYNDLLFHASNGLGKDLSSYVEVSNNVNPFKVGTYTITYTLNYQDYHEILKRTIIVKENTSFTLVLNGKKEEYVLLNSNYEDKGCYKKDNDTGEEENIISTFNNVDTNKIGEYKVVYRYSDSEIERRVIVFDIPYQKQMKGFDVEIILDVSNVNNYYRTKLPDGKFNYSNKINYLIKENGDYSFIVYDTFNNEYLKIIKIEDLINDISCVGNINIDGTLLELKGKSLKNISNIKWIVDGKEIDGNNFVKVNSIVNNGKATITINNKDEIVNCSIKDNLVYHFKYDENYSKPLMTCNSYTANDKVVLDKKLEQAIALVGYGTRAGVVEAARFIVGGLDYKIPYLGPKKVDYNLGRYPYKGLNIGNKTSWGCSVSGYIQGIDCTNFIHWAFEQNGMQLNNIYSTENAYKTRNIVNNLQVGDFLLTPCEDTCLGAFTHIGIIIGIDEKYIYVAEATTAKIDAVVTTKWEKNNMPINGKFSYARKHNYNSNGNITNMWLDYTK